MKFGSKVLAATVLVAASVIAVEANGITLKVDQVRQRYPWNGLVDIDYTVTLGQGETLGLDDNLEVLMVDKNVTPAVTNRAITFLQVPLPMTAGPHRITWNANADHVTNRTDNADFHVTLAHYAPTYMVIDVSKGSTAETYPVDFLNGAPAGGFNTDLYKGDKIVLRCIHPGSYIAGSPDDEAGRQEKREVQHPVTLSKPFYIGIFEITQQQYQNVAGNNPAGLKGENDLWKHRPVETVGYQTFRQYFMNVLTQKCRTKSSDTGEYDTEMTAFDFPTEFQWEYACRAGTTGAFNTTNSFDNASLDEQIKQLERLGRYKDNQSKGAGDITTGHTAVGSYLPNEWGLYDMHGNVWEWCRDGYREDVENLNQLVDPIGAGGETLVMRGGSWSEPCGWCRSATRSSDSPARILNTHGFRISLTVE